MVSDNTATYMLRRQNPTTSIISETLFTRVFTFSILLENVWCSCSTSSCSPKISLSLQSFFETLFSWFTSSCSPANQPEHLVWDLGNIPSLHPLLWFCLVRVVWHTVTQLFPRPKHEVKERIHFFSHFQSPSSPTHIYTLRFPPFFPLFSFFFFFLTWTLFFPFLLFFKLKKNIKKTFLRLAMLSQWTMACCYLQSVSFGAVGKQQTHCSHDQCQQERASNPEH